MNQYPRQKSVTELTADRIREAIILGEIPLGTKLSEQKLADQYQVSRSPVREALVLLQIESLVKVFPKRGSFIFSPDEHMTRDLCEHRKVMETACLDLGISRNHRCLIEGMRAGMDQMLNAVSTMDTKQYSRGDLSFHRAIIASSDNHSMIKSYETTIGPLMALRTHLFTERGIHFDRSMEEHTEMLDACIKKDVSRAQIICMQHVNHLSEHFEEEQIHDAQ